MQNKSKHMISQVINLMTTSLLIALISKSLRPVIGAAFSNFSNQPDRGCFFVIALGSVWCVVTYSWPYE